MPNNTNSNSRKVVVWEMVLEKWDTTNIIVVEHLRCWSHILFSCFFMFYLCHSSSISTSIFLFLFLFLSPPILSLSFFLPFLTHTHTHTCSYSYQLQSTSTNPQTIGKLSFIDLAGSERGSDLVHNNKQTRSYTIKLDYVILYYIESYLIELHQVKLSMNLII